MNNTILLITTEGCKGCEIAKNIISNAINTSESKNISFELIDCCNKQYKDIIKNNEIKDFPTTIFIKDDIIKHKLTGTYCIDDLCKFIDFYFS